MLDKERKVREIIDYVEKNNISAYSIAKATKVSEAGVGKILNKSSKNPRDLTIDAIHSFLFKEDVKEDIEVLYAEHMEFKNAISIIKEQGYKAYEIHKQTGLNESGIRRVLNNEIDNPQRKTRKGIIQFANSVSTDVDVTENVDFRDLKIDDKLNVIFNQLQTLKENQNAIASIKEDIALNNEIICKNDRALMLYNLNIQAVFKELKESKVIVKKLS